jgi:predicted MFS family arabinose efflux permease
MSIRKKTDAKKRSVSYLSLFKNASFSPLFAFRACFTTGVAITWTFIPLLASIRLDLSSSAIGVVVMVHVFVAGSLQIPMGYLADRLNKNFMVTAGGILGVASVFYLNTASSFGEFILANGLLGLAGGISVPAIMALGVIGGRNSDAMGGMMGFLALSHSVGMFLGPLLGGLLIDLFSFEAVFSLGAAIIGAGTIVFLFFSGAGKDQTIG